MIVCGKNQVLPKEKMQGLPNLQGLLTVIFYTAKFKNGKSLLPFSVPKTSWFPKRNWFYSNWKRSRETSCKLQGFWGSDQILGKSESLRIADEIWSKFDSGTIWSSNCWFSLVWATRTTAVPEPKPMPKSPEGLWNPRMVCTLLCCSLVVIQHYFQPWFSAYAPHNRFVKQF